jgi:HEAT repeat protein
MTRRREAGGGRWAAARLLSSVIGAAAFVTVLVACAKDGNAQTTSSARTRDDTASVARLLAAVRGSDPLLCEMAVRNVDMHGWWSHGPSSALETDSASTALIVWIQQGHKDPAVVPRLRSALRDSDACVRRVAGSFLGRVDHPSATAALLAALDDASVDTRTVAVLGLGLSDERSQNTPGVADALLRRLRDESPVVRRSAAWALGAIEAPAALLPLIDVLGKDADARVRQAAAWAIGQLKG